MKDERTDEEAEELSPGPPGLIVVCELMLSSQIPGSEARGARTPGARI